MRCAERLRAQAYFDDELDSVSAANIERHRLHCAECSALLDDFDQMRIALRRDVAYLSTPPALRARILRALNEEGAAKHPCRQGERVRKFLSWPFWRGALSDIGGSAIVSKVASFFLASELTAPLVDDLLSAHVRSLMPDHMIAMVSTERHRVEQPFAGHADVSPLVADFTGHGYRLVGVRTHYLGHQRAAVVVYQRGSHVINVFSWSASQRGLPKNTTRSGYHLAFWRTGNLVYCAVSDSAWHELFGLARLLQHRTIREAR